MKKLSLSPLVLTEDFKQLTKTYLRSKASENRCSKDYFELMTCMREEELLDCREERLMNCL